MSVAHQMVKKKSALPLKIATLRTVPDRDANKEALEQVEKATDSERAKGEDLLGSEELKRQLREAKERERSREEKPKT